MVINKATKIEVFKTNIQNKRQSKLIKAELLQRYPDLKIDFDLEDSDSVLRVEGYLFSTTIIINLITSKKFKCESMH